MAPAPIEDLLVNHSDIEACTWSPENGFVTPTFKVKRNRVEDAYDQQYEAWLAQRKPVVWVAG